LHLINIIGLFEIPRDHPSCSKLTNIEIEDKINYIGMKGVAQQYH